MLQISVRDRIRALELLREKGYAVMRDGEWVILGAN